MSQFFASYIWLTIPHTTNICGISFSTVTGWTEVYYYKMLLFDCGGGYFLWTLYFYALQEVHLSKEAEFPINQPTMATRWIMTTSPLAVHRINLCSWILPPQGSWSRSILLPTHACIEMFYVNHSSALEEKQASHYAMSLSAMFSLLWVPLRVLCSSRVVMWCSASVGSVPTILLEGIQTDTTGKHRTARTSSMVGERIAIPVLS